MHKYFRSSIFFGPNDETQLGYYSYDLNSIPDFFLNYWSKKDHLNCGTMGHFLIENELHRDKPRLQGHGLQETLKKGNKNKQSLSSTKLQPTYLQSYPQLNRLVVILCDYESKVCSAWSHTAAFKLGGLFDILALFSTSRINL